MSKKRLSLSKDQKILLLCLLFCVILFGIFLFAKPQVLSSYDEKGFLFYFWFFIGFLSGIIGSIGGFCSILAFIISIFEKHAAEKAYKKSLIDIQALPSEFTKVTLKDIQLPFFLNREDFKCTAKLDESGKVICKVELNSTFSTEDYESFLANFTINSSDAKD